MPYAFNKILDEMNQGQTNIFGQGQGTEVAGSGQVGSSAPQTSGTGGQDVGQGSGSSAPQGAGQGASVATPAASQTAAIAAKNQPKTPGFVGQLKGDITASQEKAQKEADQFVQSQKFDSSIEMPKIREAVKTGKFDTLSDYLKPTAAKGRDFEFSSDDDFTGKAKSLGTQSGLQEKLLEGQGGMYSGRRAKFDAGLLLSDANYRQQQKEAEQRAEAALAQRKTAEESAEGQSQSAAASAQSAKQKAFQEAVKGLQAELLRDLQNQAKTATQKTKQQAQIQRGGKFTKDAMDAALADLRTNPDFGKYVDQAVKGGRLNPNNLTYMSNDPAGYNINNVIGNEYFKYTPQAADWRSVASDEQRNLFGNIENLLGISGIGGQQGGVVDNSYDPLTGYSFDKEGFSKAVLDKAAQLKAFEQFNQDLTAGAAPQAGMANLGLPSVDPSKYGLDLEKLLKGYKDPTKKSAAKKQPASDPNDDSWIQTFR